MIIHYERLVDCFYDGRTLHGADLPPAITTGVTVIAGGALEVGNYRYLVRAKHVDAHGNILVWAGQSFFI